MGPPTGIPTSTPSARPSRCRRPAAPEERSIERGIPDTPSAPIYAGRPGRHLQSVAPLGSGALRGVVLDSNATTTLAGGPGVIAIASPESFTFPGKPATTTVRRALHQSIFQAASPILAGGAQSTLSGLDILTSIDFSGYVPAIGAVYPTTGFGECVRNTAARIEGP